MVWPWLPRLSTYIHFTYLGIIHASEPAHTCTRARGASPVVEAVEEEGRRHISSLFLLLKFLSLLSRHYPQSQPLPTSTQLRPNSNPTPTQLQPTTKNFIFIIIMGGCDCTSSCGCASSESCTCVSFFFPYTINGTYLPRYSRFMMMMMMMMLIYALLL